jgi:hypothetical protein
MGDEAIFWLRRLPRAYGARNDIIDLCHSEELRDEESLG